MGTEGGWVLAAAFARPDTLQVGVNIYSDSKPDLQVCYEDVRVAMVTDETGCTQDS